MTRTAWNAAMVAANDLTRDITGLPALGHHTRAEQAADLDVYLRHAQVLATLATAEALHELTEQVRLLRPPPAPGPGPQRPPRPRVSVR